ncbi:MAG: hypothetical protein OXB90_01870 [Acidimicrobiaceae bacterium]|nr:hypothetical protein [Acidimicrobiaceae bacterium]
MSHGETARLIPVSGIKGRKEAEDRATSALLAVMTVVRPFASVILGMFGVRIGKRAQIEAFVQPECETSDGTSLRPDGLIRVSQGKKVAFEAYVEVKTGAAPLRLDQLTAYIEAAKANDVPAVISISNEIAPSPGVHPTEGIRVRGRTGPDLHHVSWAKIVSKAIKEHHHRGIEDPEQAWILGELIRYLTHPNSGVVDFSDMGTGWVSVRDGAFEDRLSKRDPAVADVCQRWDQLLSVTAMRLSVDTGSDTIEVIPKTHQQDSRLRSKGFIDSLCETGILSGELRVPDTVGDIELEVNLRARRITLSTRLRAPDDRTARARVVWLVRQLRNAPESLLVDAFPKATKSPVTASLAELREDPLACLSLDKKPPARFILRLHSQMGTSRATKRTPGFIDSVIDATVTYYAEVLQGLQTFVPKAPPISPPASSKSDDESTDAIDGDESCN